MIDGSQIQTPSVDTIVFKLKFPYSPFKSTLASPTYSWIFPREAPAGGYDPAKQMIGSGPFTFDSYTPDVAFSLKRNPDWFEKGRPYVDAIRWSIVPDPAQGRAQFSSGHLDVIGNIDGSPISVNDIDSLKHDNPKAAEVTTDPGNGEQTIYLQTVDPASAFQDVRVRRAVSMAIDRDALAKAIYNNDAERQFYVYLWLGKWALKQSDMPPETAQYYRYDPAGARQLLTQAGALDRAFKLVYVTGYLGPQYEQASQAVANMLAGAGMKVTPLAVDYQKDFIGGGKGIRYGNYDKDWLISASPSGYDEAGEFIYNYYSSRAYLDMQKYLADKVYTVAGFPMVYSHTLIQPRVQGYQHSVSYGVATEAYTKLWLHG